MCSGASGGSSGGSSSGGSDRINGGDVRGGNADYKSGEYGVNNNADIIDAITGSTQESFTERYGDNGKIGEERALAEANTVRETLNNNEYAAVVPQWIVERNELPGAKTGNTYDPNNSKIVGFEKIGYSDKAVQAQFNDGSKAWLPYSQTTVITKEGEYKGSGWGKSGRTTFSKYY